MDSYQSWIGNAEWVPDFVDPRSFAAMDALMGGSGDWPEVGTQLPPLWHWMMFQPRAPQRDIDCDGHGKRGGFMPPVNLPRRLFASAEVEMHQSLTVGDHARAKTTIESISEKTGSTGQLIFVEVSFEVMVGEQLSLKERRNYVYREDASQAKPSKPSSSVRSGDWETVFRPDTTHLFRFSALTFNAHRIHYDLPYAQTVEGYRGLVVQGQYVAMKMLGACLQACPNHLVSKFGFRARSPLFEGEAVTLSGRLDGSGNSADLWALNESGEMCLSGTVLFAE